MTQQVDVTVFNDAFQIVAVRLVPLDELATVLVIGRTLYVFDPNNAFTTPDFLHVAYVPHYRGLALVQPLSALREAA